MTDRFLSKARVRRAAVFCLRWGIAVAGIAWVISNMTFRDRVVLYKPGMSRPVDVALVGSNPANQTYMIIDPDTRQRREVGRGELVNRPDRKWVELRTDRGPVRVELLAMNLSDDLHQVRGLLVGGGPHGSGVWIDPWQIQGGFELRVPQPLVEVGLATMVRQADPWLLVLAVLVFPVTFILTSIRWDMLLRVLEIRLAAGRAFVLNMVGCFYSTFMPGSTGGDLLKAWYASKHTVHRMRAVISVLVDRVIGLLALVVLGGTMAAFRFMPQFSPRDPATIACRHVAMACGAILAGVVITAAVFYIPILRRGSGLAWVLRRLPMQRQVQSAIVTLEMLGRHPLVSLWALVMTFPVHITVVISAMLAGKALGLPLSAGYYFVVVPVVVLVAAIPISPQGAGVMEVFAVALTARQGASVSQAFALTMSIRAVQIFWNLTGGIFVMRGDYHAPSASETQALSGDDASAASPPPPASPSLPGSASEAAHADTAL